MSFWSFVGDWMLFDMIRKWFSGGKGSRNDNSFMNSRYSAASPIYRESYREKYSEELRDDLDEIEDDLDEMEDDLDDYEDDLDDYEDDLDDYEDDYIDHHDDPFYWDDILDD